MAALFIVAKGEKQHNVYRMTNTVWFVQSTEYHASRSSVVAQSCRLAGSSHYAKGKMADAQGHTSYGSTSTV